MRAKKGIDWIWDAWCIGSVIGIWPRYIEPNLLSTIKINLAIPNLPTSLDGTTLLQFSDLHWSGHFSPSFSQRLVNKINALKPDLIVFTGDFITKSKLENPIGLKKFLCSLKSKFGNFAVCGNHDYASYVTPDDQGNYAIEKDLNSSNLHKGFKRMFKKVILTRHVTEMAKNVGMHSALCHLLGETPFQLLDNQTRLLDIKGSKINISGLGEYTLGRCCPEKAFENYDRRYPGVILTHNPDSIPLLAGSPGHLILAGHTHGGQVNLPFLWKQFTHMEQMEYKRGLKKQNEKWVYINRGVGSVMPFRWFSVPELTLITLQRG